ncbi:multiple epidermal growth factor-like domains protein 11 [Megalops cyprinoides]|uniref:multiple epidermal growth factor-like domains protein 11 n=1 Tax=Megalops cyprinoides TaxID=118141 RepID=UPI001863B06D|nr:multiple epidermal growth factor-like domains protein 11 [Megalops cyprinoides]
MSHSTFCIALPNAALTLDKCLACPEGYFCGSEGLGLPTGPCAPGFLCYGGAQVPNPTDPRSGSLCPPGAFCQLGITAGLCSAGYFCDWGSSSPEQKLCPAGSYCPRGTDAPVPCPPGTFSPARGGSSLEDCMACPPGHFCQGEGVVQPEPCPRGHYCPLGVREGTEFPCPPGTVRPQPGASSPEECQSCPAGMFCALHGLSEPTGPCQAGYQCPAGATSPNATAYMVRSATNTLCPPGHYCPAGTGYPLPCPPGSYSSSPGLSRVEQCHPCPSGHYCARPALADVSKAALCDAGYVCLGGSVGPRPSDGVQGHLCPRGFRCPIGTPVEVPCEPGTYAPVPGAAVCLPCPPGATCRSSGTHAPSVCPAGHYCPAGTAQPLPCPAGALSELTGARSLSTCVPCPAGLYCSTPGSSQPQGPCQEGYYCQGGATAMVPQSSAAFPRNGPCPLGHYCPAGTPSPLPCPTGSIRNQTGGRAAESCLPCPPGHYCASEGRATPSGPCSAGFYCPPEFSSTSPHAFLCPKGHFCLEGSGLPLPCPTGEYQPTPGSDSCIPCRPGYYCEESIAGDPWPCPPHSYCPAATMVPQPCPNGTFTPPDIHGLQEEGECLPCPRGMFCRAGRVLGRCAAGYLCVSGSAEFTPQGPPLRNWSQCERGVQCASPCPAGFYCVEGADQAEPCPAHTVRASPGGRSRNDCLPCPPRHWCKRGLSSATGDPSLHLCPAGHYCEGRTGADSEEGGGPVECPIFTYRSAPGAGGRGDCHPCPPGSFCNSTGLTGYSGHQCPPGFWCSGAGPPVPCPAGTMRPQPGAATADQCQPCTAGTFCPDPGATGRPNIHGTPCRASFQCPPGAVAETPCKAGSYCGPQTGEPMVCPGGYFCPEGSHTYDTPQQVCRFPYYCPENSALVRLCEGGYMPLNSSRLRDALLSSCVPCEGGTHRPSLSPTLHCLSCPPGYHCPPGQHCFTCAQVITCAQVSTVSPVPTSALFHLCPGQRCFTCAQVITCAQVSTVSPVPQVSTVSPVSQFSPVLPVPRTGFVFYNELDFKSTDTDSELDCQPEVNERCSTGQVRLASSRECVSPSGYLCNVTCGAPGGGLSVELGICRCESYVAAEGLCNASCLSTLPRVSARRASDGQLQLRIKGRDEKGVWTRSKFSFM